MSWQKRMRAQMGRPKTLERAKGREHVATSLLNPCSTMCSTGVLAAATGWAVLVVSPGTMLAKSKLKIVLLCYYKSFRLATCSVRTTNHSSRVSSSSAWKV